MGRMYPAGGTKLAQFEALWIIFLILRGGVVAALAGCANQRHHNTILFAFCHTFLQFMFGPGLPFICVS